MSIIPIPHPTDTGLPWKDSIGRRQWACKNCGYPVVIARWAASTDDLVHPHLGYAKYCTDPLVGTRP
jgi:hypothetical protein